MLKYKGLRLYIDLGAEKIIDNKEIAVEVKVFGGNSFVNDFEGAIGQYNLYKSILNKANFNHELYLAISRQSYEKFNAKPAIVEFIAEAKIYLVIFDPEREEILEWIK